MKEKNLTINCDRNKILPLKEEESLSYYIDMSDESIAAFRVKEFIKLLKEETTHFDGWNFSSDAEAFRKIINQLAGDNLI